MKKLRFVVLLLTVLFMLPSCQRSLQNARQDLASERDSAIRELMDLAIACHLYAQQNNGKLPTAMPQLRSYLQEPFDPGDFLLVASGMVEDFEDTSKAVLIRRKDLFPDGQQAVVYIDGHAELVPMNAK